MTMYEKQMSEMTPEILAHKNTQMVLINGRQPFFLTSSGQLFDLNKEAEAVQHEYNWLMYDPDSKDQEADNADCDR